MKNPRIVIALAGISIVATSVRAHSADSDAAVRINQIQVIGTHNSYHAGLQPGIAKLMQQMNPQAYATLEYAHAALAAQLDHGVRQIELDIFADSKGGRFAHPLGPAMVAEASCRPIRSRIRAA